VEVKVGKKKKSVTVRDKLDADCVAGILTEIIDEFHLRGRLLSITSDNEAVCRAACEKLNPTVPWLPCLAHTLNLIVRDATVAKPDVAPTGLMPLCTRAHVFVKKVRNTTFLREELQRYVGIINNTILEGRLHIPLLPDKLIQDVPTRWNSLYMAMERMHALKHALVALQDEVKDDVLPQADRFTGRDWTLLEHALELLRPFYELTLFLSQGDY